MATSPAETIKQEIEELKEALQAAHDKLVVSCDSLETLEHDAQLALADADPGTQMAAFFDQLKLHVEATGEGDMGAGFDACDASAAAFSKALAAGSETLAQRLDAAAAALADSAASLGRVDGAIAARHEPALGGAGGGVSQAYQHLATEFQEGTDDVAAILSCIGEELVVTQNGLLKTALSNFASAAKTVLASDVDQAMQHEAQSLQSFFSTLQAGIDDAGDDLDQFAEQLFSQVAQEIQSSIDQGFTAVRKDAEERIAQSLLEEVMQSVVATGVSQQLTAAMAPVLPELIALFKVSQAIKSALQTWRSLRNSLGVVL